MQSLLTKPLIQVLYSLAQQGLIHRKRMCPSCFIHPMQIIHVEDVDNKFIWKCTHCFYACSVQKSTILSCVNIRQFDIALTLWMMNAKTLAAARMINMRTKCVVKPSDEYFKLFRKAHSHYVEKNIFPFLVLSGPIEIDESKVNHKKFHC